MSLRKHIDSCHNTLTESSLATFRSALMAIGECGAAQPVPATHPEPAAEEVAHELSEWAGRALRHHRKNERELREIIGAVAKTAESVGDRDARFAEEIGEVARRLSLIAEFEDLAAMRNSVIESTAHLRACVKAMSEENRNSVRLLTSQVAEYRARLAKSERESAVDPLTGLANRRSFERHLNSEIGRGQRFSLLLIDLNDFKAVNDRFGHLAGDDLLRQFAAELHAQFSPLDLVARWGGDEFAAVVAGTPTDAEARVIGIQNRVFRDYRIHTGETYVNAHAWASIGAAEWDGRETGDELLARADKSGYCGKPRTRAAR